MSAGRLRLYHRLPYPLKCLAASLQGMRRSRWRYGPETDRLVEEAAAREHDPPERWATWQAERLAAVLRRAAEHVPYYRSQWSQRAPGEDASWQRLENWPLLEKEPLRAQPELFVAEDCDRRRMWHEHTSGTSGKPLDLWFSRETVHRWYAWFEARWRRWNGVSRHDRWAILGGQLVTAAGRKRPPFWVWNAALRQLYLSSYHLAPRNISAYLDALIRYRVRYVWGYTSSLYALAQEALRLGRQDLRMTVALTNAEPVSPVQREVIAAAFQCPVRETYGMAEIVAAAGECQAGRLHLWPEAGIVEVLGEDGQPAPRGVVGELVCTGLCNADMPLIRYRIGDRGALDDDPAPCPCGRTLPRLKCVEGRSDDVLFTPDGRRVGRLDPVFKSRLPIREAQIVQERLDRFVVRFVPTSDYTAEAGQTIVEQLRQRLGNVTVRLEPVEQLERTANGKLRAVVCQLSPEELASRT